MLYRTAFHLSGRVASLHLDNNSARLVCHILEIASKHFITLIQAYIPTCLSLEIDYLLWGRLVPEGHLPPHIA